MVWFCAMGYAGGGDIPHAMNRVENHAKIEEAFRKNIPIAAKAGVVNVITFSGNRDGMSDEEGAKNTIIGLNRVKKIGEDHGSSTSASSCSNSKVDHHDYMCDHSAWGLKVVQEVNSPRVKLLYDIYHMQIMEGDLVRTIQKNIDWIAHFHTGGGSRPPRARRHPGSSVGRRHARHRPPPTSKGTSPTNSSPPATRSPPSAKPPTSATSERGGAGTLRF